MSEFLSQIILAKVPVEQVVRRYNSEFNPNSALCTCINPSHSDSTPSMKIYKDTNTVYCFGCGFSGNPISIVSKIEGISLIQSMHKLKEWFGIKEDLTELSLVERSNIQRDRKEFDRTFDFYSKQWKKQQIRLSDQTLSDLEDIFIMKDVKALKQIYIRIKDGKITVL